MLEVRDLSAERSERCLFDGLSLRLESGQLMQVAGPNGVGKTTLLGMVAGLSQPLSGEIFWNGISIAEDPQAFRRSFSYLGHLSGMKAALSASENLSFALALRGLKVSVSAVFGALEQVGLRGYEHTPVNQLSAGQKRRVALARLRLEAAPLWILDEPFTALDRKGVSELEHLLGEHAIQGGMVLFTTHHDLADRLPVKVLDVAAFRPRSVS